MNWDELLQALREFEDADFSGGVDDAQIDAAAEKIGLMFPRGYRRFLHHFGSGGIESEEFIGLGGPAHLDVIERVVDLRAKPGPSVFPRTLIPVRADGFGNYDCIDTLQPTHDGEFAVVQWLHDGGNEQRMEVLGESYVDWFGSMLKLLRDIRA